MNRPLIALTGYHEPASWGVWRDVPCALLPWDYVRQVADAGGAPVLLPPVPEAVPDVMARVDGLLLAGGPDIDPARYGEVRAPETQPARPARDEAELAALAAAEQRGLPVLAICRGAQLVTVARGGTLRQHLPEHTPTRPGHYDPYSVHITADSKLATALGPEFTVSCAHHQGIDKLGSNLTAVAWAEDGTIEAIEDPTAHYLVGIQSHPEVDPATAALFRTFVSATCPKPARESGVSAH
ncbi:gamma-glutamyl-gamma-aminobutyrate hydrolase family protein [Pseudonocardia acaciae]|uniref:gamma-glutamyl-gamma-aminobutyrate hydrolase family protein n=1 Tax=Pseudonocardia acaciae TaxID=551276 RepID=UPI0007E8DBB4|nr:gamma-glutamyl-gamma-aminobutyrate hydrolase family protein [Pseudonocardia acaciae]